MDRAGVKMRRQCMAFPQTAGTEMEAWARGRMGKLQRQGRMDALLTLLFKGRGFRGSPLTRRALYFYGVKMYYKVRILQIFGFPEMGFWHEKSRK